MGIYKRGLLGRKPRQPVSTTKLEKEAEKTLKPEAHAYLTGAAGGGDTLLANREAFHRWRIIPRLLRDVAQRDLNTHLLGQTLASPILLAPIGALGILHKHGELAAARAARSLEVPLILSTVSCYTMEEVAEEMDDARRWFQLYWPADRDLTVSFLHRAENAGYSTLVVTLDTSLLSWREHDLENAYLPYVRGHGLANYFSDPVFQARIGGNPKRHPVRALDYFGKIFANPALTWADLAFLRDQTRLPILLKGILHPDDARQAIDHGMDGVIVSNHGGRQLDGAVAALDALPQIADAVSGRAAVLFDSGIRRGSDVFKALALGARAVLLGRPYCYGLAVNGEEGVCQVVQNLLADFDLTLGLAGCASIKEVGRESVVEGRA